MRAGNILCELNIHDKEDVISDLIRYCFNKSAYFRKFFLERICAVEASGHAGYKALTRKLAGSAGVPDLLIFLDQPDHTDLILIENKLRAGEGDTQTQRYAAEGVAQDINRIHGFNKKLGKTHHVFLTLCPAQTPGHTAFTHQTYEPFVTDLDPRAITEDLEANLLMSHWRDLLVDFYDSSRISPQDHLLARLTKGDPLGGDYLYFDNLFKLAPLPEGLEFEYTYRGSARGRHYYGAVFSKAHWHTGKLVKMAESYRLPDGDVLNYSIHIEPQLNLLNGQLSTYLHYELNPYTTQPLARAHLSPADMARYQQRRARFVELLRLAAPEDWQITAHWNQIGKSRLAIDDTWSTNDYWREFHRQTERICAAIDRVLTQMENTPGEA